MQKPKYNTWTRKNRIAIFAVISVVLIVIVILRLNTVISILAVVLALPFIYITFVLLYTLYQFSEIGGNYQTQIHNLIVTQIMHRSGKLLDIGSGSGSLIIKAAKAMPEVTATGIDYWGSDWGEYSKKLCESNAQIEGVSDKVNFVQGSASKLPFSDNEFDILISCLTFHEVKDESDKLKLLQEALRTLKSGGEFVLMDLFLDDKIFGNLNELTANLGVSKIEVENLGNMIFLPRLLLLKQCLGFAVIIKGIK